MSTPSPHLTANFMRMKAVAEARTVLAGLQRIAAVSHPMVGGAALAATAFANVPGMSDIYNNWESIHSRLDNTIKALLNNLATKNADGWIAADRDAFVDAVERFQQAVESLRGYIKTIAGLVDDLGSAYRSYWTALAEVLAVLVAMVTLALAMLATPFAPKGYLLLQTLGAWGASMIAGLTGMLAKGIVGVTAGMSVMLGGKAMIQLYHLAPTGEARVDFTKAEIDARNVPSFQDPPTPGQLPQYGNFEWLAPRRDQPAPYQP
ncbi:hypothetical protein HNP84_007942 [Thermocatellispora tengchongensis]|uniref:Uncharacterized protein n=1 Tax=Thermocatellispora tengchongensis TaxID=1073253 RepID=A0A840PGT4_9ACTN|nr:hypothetical protein [Thermocatellispora tengchongensis]MBB5138189.1 hypothetical protein [Thermocatellispora tengchongensis]